MQPDVVVVVVVVEKPKINSSALGRWWWWFLFSSHDDDELRKKKLFNNQKVHVDSKSALLPHRSERSHTHTQLRHSNIFSFLFFPFLLVFLGEAVYVGPEVAGANFISARPSKQVLLPFPFPFCAESSRVEHRLLLELKIQNSTNLFLPSFLPSL